MKVASLREKYSKIIYQRWAVMQTMEQTIAEDDAIIAQDHA
jgi:hypothetical protein